MPLRWARAVWPPLALGAVVLVAWIVAVPLFGIKPYVIPAPADVARFFVQKNALIREATAVTGFNAVVGLLVGTAAGIAMAFVLLRSRALHEMFNPLAIALNAVPIFVLVSVFAKMFPSTSEVPRRSVVALIVYFIVLVNVSKGLRQVQPTHLELLRSYAASPTTVLRKVRIPNAVSFLFIALKIAAPVAVITAFVAEYFGGRKNGLGSRITTNMSSSKTDAAWAYVAGAMLLGLGFYLISILLENLTSPHRGASPGGEST